MNETEKNDKKTKSLENKVEGKKALEELFKALEQEGLLQEPSFLKRLTALEAEVKMLKELIASSINIKKTATLKD